MPTSRGCSANPPPKDGTLEGRRRVSFLLHSVQSRLHGHPGPSGGAMKSLGPLIGGGTAEDCRFLGQALELARRGEGWTHPNPMVGSLVVREGEIVGRGYHARAGM